MTPVARHADRNGHTVTPMTLGTRRLTSATLLLAGTLVLSACGGDDTATTGAASGTTASEAPAAAGNDADVAFLTGMQPHHEQAVEMSQIVLAADPPAEVAALARQIQAAQAPEIDEMDEMLGMLGHGSTAMPHGDMDMASHGGMMSEEHLADMRAATGTEAARLFLEGMIEHHQGAIDAAEAQLEDGQYAPALALAEQIEQAQTAEIAEMQALLASL